MYDKYDELQEAYGLSDEDIVGIKLSVMEANESSIELAQAAMDDGIHFAVRDSDEQYVNIDWLRMVVLGAMSQVTDPVELNAKVVSILIHTIGAVPIYLDRVDPTV